MSIPSAAWSCPDCGFETDFPKSIHYCMNTSCPHPTRREIDIPSNPLHPKGSLSTRKDPLCESCCPPYFHVFWSPPSPPLKSSTADQPDAHTDTVDAGWPSRSLARSAAISGRPLRGLSSLEPAQLRELLRCVKVTSSTSNPSTPTERSSPTTLIVAVALLAAMFVLWLDLLW